MDSKQLYKKAYDLQYSERDYDQAAETYKKVMEQFPDSPEANYAKTQIQNIEKMSEGEKKAALAELEKKKKPLAEAQENTSQAQPEDGVSSQGQTPRKRNLVPRFPALIALSSMFAFVGWAGVILSGICVVLGFGQGGTARLLIVFGALGALMSLIIVAIGEWTKVFLAIEENTRKT